MTPNNWTYFFEDYSTGQIKIGQSINPDERLRYIRVKRPGARLLAVLPDHSLERELHERFDHLRVEGEWFRGSKELRQFIRAYGLPSAEMPEGVSYRTVAGAFGMLHLAAFLFLMGAGLSASSPNWSVATIWPLAVMLVYGLYGLWLFGTRNQVWYR